MKQWMTRFPLTASLMGSLLLVYVAMLVTYPGRSSSSEAVFGFGGLLGLALGLDWREGWRLLAANFVHIGWQHLAMNLFSLYLSGRVVEELFGTWAYAGLFLLSGLMGGLLTTWLSPMVLSAGASAGLFGFFAALAVLGYWGRHPVLKAVGKQFQSLLLVNLAMNLFMPEVNIWGHLGGALGGALLAVALPNRLPQPLCRRLWRLLSLLAYLLLVLLFAYLTLGRVRGLI